MLVGMLDLQHVQSSQAVTALERATKLRPDDAVAHWFGNAEKVMANLCMMSDVGRFGGRGHSARFKWTRPNVRQMLGRARVSSAARSWFWLADRLGELAVLVERPPAKCWAHRCGLMGKLRAWMPPTGEVDLKQLWIERLREVQGAGVPLLRDWQGLATDLAEAEAASWISRRRREIREWVSKACAGAARGAHRVTKQPVVGDQILVHLQVVSRLIARAELRR